MSLNQLASCLDLRSEKPGALADLDNLISIHRAIVVVPSPLMNFYTAFESGTRDLI